MKGMKQIGQSLYDMWVKPDNNMRRNKVRSESAHFDHLTQELASWHDCCSPTEVRSTPAPAPPGRICSGMLHFSREKEDGQYPKHSSLQLDDGKDAKHCPAQRARRK